MKFMLTFVILSIINVVFSTFRSIITIKGGKILASLMSGGYFAFYNIMLIYTVANFPMWEKCLITFICNVIGVYLVKWIEEKSRKDKLWKIETTVSVNQQNLLIKDLAERKISFNYIEGIGKYTIVNIFSNTQKESSEIKKVLNNYKVKYFVTETKYL